MQKYICIFFLTACLACSSPNDTQIPVGVLPQDTMGAVLADMHLADGMLNTHPGSVDSMNQANVNYREFIYKKYHTDNAQFQKSFAFYQEHPALLDTIYAGVITRLSKKEAELHGK